MSSQGSEANRGGLALERFVEGVISQYDFLILRHGDDGGNTQLFDKKLLIKNVPYANIFGGYSRSEFVVVHEEFKRRIRIECRWQQEAGSTDEKLAALYLNAANAMPENEIILLIDGGGARDYVVQAIRDWAKTGRFDDLKTKKITVMTMAEFQSWFHLFMRGKT